jgi:hypothetical protein
MKRMCRFLVATVALVLLGVAVSSAQTLADVARKEGERRKALGKATKVYTNDDVKSTRPLTTAAARPEDKAGPGGGASAVGTPATERRAPAATGAPGAPAAIEGGDPAEGGAPAETAQAKLKQQAAELRQLMTRDRLAAEALQSRANALRYQAEQISDPTLKARFMADHDVIAADLALVRHEAEEKGKALAEIEEKLRSTDQ